MCLSLIYLVENRLAQLEAKIQVAQGTVSPTTWSDYYRTNSRQDNTIPLPFTATICDFTQFEWGDLHPGDKETAKVQPYFSKVTTSINERVANNKSILVDGHVKVK